MRYGALVISTLLFLAACQQAPSQASTQPTQEGVTVTLVSYPEEMTSGQPATFTWTVKNSGVVEHTNIHSSPSADFSDRTDSEKQSGSDGTYTGTLTLETDTPQDVYIQAHAHVDGKDYTSEVEEIELVPEGVSGVSDEAEEQEAAVAEQAPERPQKEATPTPSTSSGTREFTVEAFRYGFSPDPVTVKQGDTVRITFKARDVTHGVSLPDFGASTPPLAPGDSYTVEFVANKKGSFGYFCNVYCGPGHRGMTGTLIVE